MSKRRKKQGGGIFILKSEWFKPHVGFALALAFSLGVLPILLVFQGREFSGIITWTVLLTNCLACFLAAWSFILRSRLSSLIEKSRQSFGIGSSRGALAVKLQSLLNEMERWKNASYMFYQREAKDQREVGRNLRRIVELAYRELPARAVQLVLFESESQKSTQTMMMGTPRVFSSQDLGENSATTSMPSAMETEVGPIQVIDEPVYFAGKQFGILRVELRQGAKLTDSDRQVLYLLASQGALLLVNSQFTDELLRMREASEESIQAKTGFLATLSHEIRGPLGIILNGVELVSDELCGPVSEMQKDTLLMVKKSGDHLLDLVNDVLDYAKVEAGNEIANPAAIPLQALLKDLSNVIRAQAAKKGHKLVLDPVDPALGIFCDKRHSRQILINILTNAVKYTPDGGTITIRAQRVRSQRAQISISDTGIGIPEDQKKKVFRPFERVDDKYARTQVGTGLGMALTKKLTEVNGGKIGFDSTLGEGSTFWIEMPVTEVTPVLVGEEETDAVLPPQGRGEKVLLVDPELPSRQVVENFLTEQNFKLVLASSGAEVMRTMRDQAINIAIVENELEDVTGGDLVRIIRNSHNSSRIPIILVSSRAFSFDVEHFLKMGVDRCLSKPVALRDLAVTMRQLIDDTSVAAPKQAE